MSHLPPLLLLWRSVRRLLMRRDWSRNPMRRLSTGQPLQVVTVETVRTIRPAVRPAVHHHVVASRKIQDRIAGNYDRPLYNTVAAPVPRTALATPVVQIQTAAVPVVATGQGLSGQFQCVQGCAAGGVGPALSRRTDGISILSMRLASPHEHGSTIPVTSGCKAGMRARFIRRTN